MIPDQRSEKQVQFGNDRSDRSGNIRLNDTNSRKRVNDNSVNTNRPVKRQNYDNNRYVNRYDGGDRNRESEAAVDNFSKPHENTRKIDPGNHKIGETYYFRNVKVTQGCKPCYTPEQSEKIRGWSREEKRNNSCTNCDDYFHISRNCKNPGKRCFRCKNFSHKGSNCPFFTERSEYFRFHKKEFKNRTVFAIDSSANTHTVNNSNLLLNYRELVEPIDVMFNTEQNTYYSKAIGVGTLPILFRCKNNETILSLKNVYFAPESRTNIISANLFNGQFKTIITLNVNTGCIIRRAMNHKITNIEVHDKMYFVIGNTITLSDIDNSAFKGEETENLILDSGETADNSKIGLDYYDSAFDVNHLPLNNSLTFEDDLTNQQLVQNEFSKICNLQNVLGQNELNIGQNKKNESFKIKLNSKKRKLTEKQLKERKTAGGKWHRRLLHANQGYVHKSRKVCEGIEEILFSDDENCCAVCALAKMVRKSFDEERTPATRVGEIVHSDVVGPLSPATYHTGNRYILFVIDGYSKFLQTFVMKTRDEVPKMVDEAYRSLQAKYPGPGQFDIFRCDKGGGV